MLSKLTIDQRYTLVTSCASKRLQEMMTLAPKNSLIHIHFGVPWENPFEKDQQKMCFNKHVYYHKWFWGHKMQDYLIAFATKCLWKQSFANLYKFSGRIPEEFSQKKIRLLTVSIRDHITYIPRDKQTQYNSPPQKKKTRKIKKIVFQTPSFESHAWS